MDQKYSPPAHYASLTDRFIAMLIDTGVMFLFFTLSSFIFVNSYSIRSAIEVPLSLWYIPLSWGIYGATLESSVWQGTIGKKMLGIKVTDKNGQRINFFRAMGRNIFKTNASQWLILAFLPLIWSKRGLHDMVAGTLVCEFEEDYRRKRKGEEFVLFENKLQKESPINSVEKLAQQIEGFPCTSYSDFLSKYEKKRIIVDTEVYDDKVFMTLALCIYGRWLGLLSIISHALLMYLPFIIAISFIIASVIQHNILLITGVPLAVFGFFHTSPIFLKKSYYKPLHIAIILLIAYSFVSGHLTTAYILGAYSVSNTSTLIVRAQCYALIKEAVLRSELIFISLYLRHRVSFRTVE